MLYEKPLYFPSYLSDGGYRGFLKLNFRALKINKIELMSNLLTRIAYGVIIKHIKLN